MRMKQNIYLFKRFIFLFIFNLKRISLSVKFVYLYILLILKNIKLSYFKKIKFGYI